MLPFILDMIVWSSEFDLETEATRGFLTQAIKSREQFLSSIKEKLEKEHLTVLM